MPDVSIRAATGHDVPRIAEIHVLSWRQTYRGMMPDAFLDTVVPGMIPEWWADRQAAPKPGRVLLVACDGRAVTGFFHGFPTSDGIFEIDNLHVAEGHRGQGLGARLFRAGAAQAVAAGHREGHLLAIARNRRAIAFYRRLGGRVLPEIDSAIPGLGPVRETPIRFADLSDLDIR